MATPEPIAEASLVSPRERVERLFALLSRARAFWRTGAVVALLVTVAGVVATLRAPRVYESETVLLVRDAIRADSRDDTPSVRAQRLGPKLKELLLARPRLEKIITELGLFAPVVEKRGLVDAVEEMRLQVGFRARDSDTFLVSYQAETADLAQKVTRTLAESMIVDFAAESVDRTAQARDFLIDEQRRADDELDQRSRELAAFMSEHPEFAWDPAAGRAPGAGAFSAAGARRGSASRHDRDHAPDRTDPELAALYRERARLERALGQGTGAQGSVSGEGAPSLKILEQAHAKAAAALEAAEIDLTEKRQRLTEEHPDVIAARARAVALGRAAGATEGAVTEARARAASEGARGEVVTAVADDDTRQKLARVRAAIAQREGQRDGRAKPSATNPSAPDAAVSPGVTLETTWQRVLRDVDDARRHKEDVTEKRNRAELNASAAVSSENSIMTVVDPAFRPSHPIKPNRALLAGLSGATGLLLGVLFALAGVVLDDTIVDAGDIEGKKRIQVLASLPRARPKANGGSTAALSRTDGKGGGRSDTGRSVRRSTLSGASQAMALVRACAPQPLTIQIDAQADGEGAEDPRVVEPFVIVGEASSSAIHLRHGELLGPANLGAMRMLRRKVERWASRHAVVGIVSPVQGEGKSRVAAQLALALSESGRFRVLLVEANFERPSLARLLSLSLPPGESFSHQLARRAGAAFQERPWAVISAGPALHVLAEREADGSKPSLLHSHQFASAIDELRGAYDYVVIDGPSVLEEGHAGSVEAVSDAVMVVARSAYSKKSVLFRALSSLGAMVLGVVLTSVDEGKR